MPDQPDPTEPAPRRSFSERPRPDVAQVAQLLRTETVGGVLLLAAAALAMGWANSPWRSGYAAFVNTEWGPDIAHLHLTVALWAADGLLALFFFVAGIELKRELVVGELRDPKHAIVPVAAAVCGVVVPAACYWVLTASTPEVRSGWAIPIATDIAFALAIMAVLGSHLPTALRTFLLTLAVVDDVIAITIIALVYTEHLNVRYLAAAGLPWLAYAVVVRRGWGRWWLLMPLALATWVLIHASGVHATVTGVALALLIPTRPRPGEQHSVAERYEHLVRPISSGIAVPLFALTAAGVNLVDVGIARAVSAPVFVGVLVGLVVGKTVGVLLGTWVTVRFTRASIDPSLAWGDIVGVALLSGIGFTVSLLIAELSLGTTSLSGTAAKAAIVVGSVLSALLASVVLGRRNRYYRAHAGD